MKNSTPTPPPPRDRIFRSDAAYDLRLAPSALRLYLALCGEDAYNDPLFWRPQHYARLLQVQESTIVSGMTALVRCGYVERIRRARGVTLIRALHALDQMHSQQQQQKGEEVRA